MGRRGAPPNQAMSRRHRPGYRCGRSHGGAGRKDSPQRPWHPLLPLLPKVSLYKSPLTKGRNREATEGLPIYLNVISKEIK